MKIGIGIDTGGTFTDAVAYDFETGSVLAKGKALTTHSRLEDGIGAALDTLPEEYIRSAEIVSLSTTLATNACLENKGSRCKLVIFGLNDEIIESNQIEKRYGIPLDSVTAVETNGSADGLRTDVPDWTELLSEKGNWLSDADVLACSELYSANNGAPAEKAFRQVIQDRFGIYTVCAHEITKELNVIARGATAMLNARLLPIINDFISSILADLKKRDCHAPVTVIRSDGSRMSAEATLNKPVETILSGPSASVLAGKGFYKGDHYLTVDMGGTTTDVSVVIGGQPVPARGGIQLGNWRTTVKGIFAAPFALGGDTRVYSDFKSSSLRLGVRRVEPLCQAAAKWPEIKDMLSRIVNVRKKHINQFPLHEILYLLHEPDRPELYSEDEQRLIRELKKGPLILEDLAERTGLDLFHFRTERLEAEEIIMRCGLTPTDFMHIKGDYTAYDREVSVLGARFLLASLGREDNESELSALCDEVYEAVEERMYVKLVHILLRQMYPDRFGEEIDPQLDFLIRRAWEDRRSAKSPILHQFFGSEMALVGIGAPIHVFLPEVAEALGAECILPEHHDVANAIGALQAEINSVVRLEVTQLHSEDGLVYVAHLPGGSRSCGTMEEAIAILEKAAAKEALKEARARGAEGVLTPEVRSGLLTAKALDGIVVPLGAVVEARVNAK
ncbi:MAG: hydantoinase/oxoprolinase family protein [Lachnospiraceae bacterium]|nr:hydantoinase/oxoprolinase family protein [Lachnospiraceae bacterium]